jgi:hypothetical protein
MSAKPHGLGLVICALIVLLVVVIVLHGCSQP